MYRMVLLPNAAEQIALALPLDSRSYTVGRSANCDIVITHTSVSRRHARLHLAGSELVVKDLNSRNGTFVDDQKIDSCSVRVGQVIRFGDAPYRVALDSSVPPTMWNDQDDETDRRSASPSQTDTSPLTSSQKRVFDLLLDGSPESAIAARLNLSVHTVHTHVKAIYTHFGVHSRAELLAQAIKAQRKQ